MCQSGGWGGPEYWTISGFSHSLTVAASRRTYDNDPHLRPHKTKPGVRVVSAGGGSRECVYMHGGPLPTLSDGSELFLAPHR